MKIVAFGHRKRVGKDTAAKFLVHFLRTQNRGISVQVAGFADKVKAVSYDLYRHFDLMPGGFYDQPENEYLRGVKLPRINKTPREIWIGVGNGLRASVYQNTWYDYLFSSASADVLLIKDMRFPDEADGILDRGGRIYRIDRPGTPEEDDGADDQLVGYTRWTAVIVNGGTLSDFMHKIETIAKELTFGN